MVDQLKENLNKIINEIEDAPEFEDGVISLDENKAKALADMFKQKFAKNLSGLEFNKEKEIKKIYQEEYEVLEFRLYLKFPHATDKAKMKEMEKRVFKYLNANLKGMRPERNVITNISINGLFIDIIVSVLHDYVEIKVHNIRSQL